MSARLSFALYLEVSGPGSAAEQLRSSFGPEATL